MSEAPIQRRTGRTLLFVAVAVALALAVGRIASSTIVEIFWFRSVDYSRVFWKLLWLRAITMVLVSVGAGALIFVNLRTVAATMGRLRIRRKFGNLEFVEQLPKRYLSWIIIGSAVLLGVWFGFSAPADTGFQVALFLNAQPWGATDPVFGHDIGFYVFLLPVLRSLTAFAIVLLFLLVGMSSVGYMATGAIFAGKGRFQVDAPALRHLTALFAAFLAMIALQVWLARYGLLSSGSSRVGGIFGYVDASARVPGLSALAIVGVSAAGVIAWAGRKQRPALAIAGLGAFAVAGIALSQMFPALIQRFEVDPNELEREAQYIQLNMDATRRGFGLDDLSTEPFQHSAADPVDWDVAAEQITGFPTWNSDALITTFQSLEARFGYYQFQNVTIDRYPGPEGVRPVAVSVRELDPSGIENPNWQNYHLRERFMRGVGAVAASATDASAEGRPRMFLSSIPPEPVAGSRAPEALTLDRPAVFFGTANQRYAVVTPTESQFLAPDSTRGQVSRDFPRGVPLGSGFMRLVTAWAFQDLNLLFSSEIGASSEFVLHRQVVARAQKIAPFLSFLEVPQAVIQDGRIVWVLDGFTQTADYPLSTAFTFGFRRPVNYLRASVKATVDAVTGVVTLYAVDDEDPLLFAYQQLFPDLFRPMGEMPESLQRHLRYPRSLLNLQTRVLRSYHLETPQQFHAQDDVWTTPTETGRGTMAIDYQPEYALYRLPGSDTVEFLLSTVFVPVGLQNLTAMLIARNDPGSYGELRLYEFRIEDRVPGPRQVEALIEQDPVLSQQFSLWRQGGSQVWTGHLHLIPVGSRMLYMEPVFLAAEEDAIPELRRFVISDGQRVVMEETLGGALAALADGAISLPATMVEGVEAATGDAGPASEALRILDEAETALRNGDWNGFGEALNRLRTHLRGTPPPPGSGP